MNITILGCGAYALALSRMFLENNCNITMWSKIPDEVKKLKNEYKELRFTLDIKDAIRDSSLLVIAIPIEYLDSTIEEFSEYYYNIPILIATKGISQNDNLFALDIVNKYIRTKDIGVISGSTFAVDMLNKDNMGLTLASNSKKLIDITLNSLRNKYLDIEVTNDMVGVMICGSIKNVMAIGSGILGGKKCSESTMCMYLTMVIKEINYLIKELGGSDNTIISYAGIGDIIMTCSSIKSRNYTLGYMIGSNANKEEIDEYINNTTIEGLYTAKSIYNLCNNKNIELPIINTIYNILYNNKDYNTLMKCFEIKKGNRE